MPISQFVARYSLWLSVIVFIFSLATLFNKGMSLSQCYGVTTS